jgi:ATP-binding cassette subfamily F protein 3
MIQVKNIHKSFGAQSLFRDVNFTIGSGERVGLVGRNGHGKTTLLKMFIGVEQADSGAISIPKNYRIGHISQQIAFSQETILAEGATGLPKGYEDQGWKVERILFGLGFSKADLQRHPDELSGGFQVRLNLAKALLSEPDLLLLDEPTNFLDIVSIRWIERFLVKWPHELLLITHDRSFMDKVVTHTIGIHRQKCRKIPGNTAKYYAQMAQEEEIYEKTRLNDERRRKDIELFISRFRAKARLANLVQSRIKTLQKMEKKEKLTSLKNLEFSFRSRPFPAKYVLHAKGLAFGYPEQPTLFQDLDFTVAARDRICIVGPNGKGKTTLLKILAGKLKALDGEIQKHAEIRLGYYEQSNTENLIPQRTVEEEILYAQPDIDQQMARNISGAMLFSGDAALKKIAVLSGGEKSRVLLGKIIAAPANILLLDEPTNHLDMEACDSLLSAIDQFEGAVIMVTHNEMFLHAIAERLIVFTQKGASLFEGSYQHFLDSDGWETEKDAAQRQTAAAPLQTAKSKKAIRRERSEIISRKSKSIKPLEKRITALETDIEALEDQLTELNQAMQQASQVQDGSRITEIARSIHRCQQKIDHLFDELEEATTRLDTENARFAGMLADLEQTSMDGYEKTVS